MRALSEFEMSGFKRRSATGRSGGLRRSSLRGRRRSFHDANSEYITWYRAKHAPGPIDCAARFDGKRWRIESEKAADEAVESTALIRMAKAKSSRSTRGILVP